MLHFSFFSFLFLKTSNPIDNWGFNSYIDLLKLWDNNNCIAKVLNQTHVLVIQKKKQSLNCYMYVFKKTSLNWIKFTGPAKQMTMTEKKSCECKEPFYGLWQMQKHFIGLAQTETFVDSRFISSDWRLV